MKIVASAIEMHWWFAI